jgi:hypothetical protein
MLLPSTIGTADKDVRGEMPGAANGATEINEKGLLKYTLLRIQSDQNLKFSNP